MRLSGHCHHMAKRPNLQRSLIYDWAFDVNVSDLSFFSHPCHMSLTSRSAFTCTQNRPATPASSDVATMTYCPCGSARRQETSRRGTKGRVRCFVSACGDNKDNTTTSWRGTVPHGGDGNGARRGRRGEARKEPPHVCGGCALSPMLKANAVVWKLMRL